MSYRTEGEISVHPWGAGAWQELGRSWEGARQVFGGSRTEDGTGTGTEWSRAGAEQEQSRSRTVTRLFQTHSVVFSLISPHTKFHPNYTKNIQVGSYYKMRSHFSYPGTRQNKLLGRFP